MPTKAEIKNKFSFVLLVPAILILAIASLVVPLAAFEAHVVNVTATIEKRPCIEYEIRSMGYWRNHLDILEVVGSEIFPIFLGNVEVSNFDDAQTIFNTKKTMADKLRAQLLALKINIIYFGLGDALVPGEGITIADLAAAADALLSQSPLPPDDILEDMKDRIEATNTAERVSTCPPLTEEPESTSGGTEEIAPSENGGVVELSTSSGAESISTEENSQNQEISPESELMSTTSTPAETTESASATSTSEEITQENLTEILLEATSTPSESSSTTESETPISESLPEASSTSVENHDAVQAETQLSGADSAPSPSEESSNVAPADTNTASGDISSPPQ